MKRHSLKIVLTICAIFGLCIALGVGRAQASLIGPNTPYPYPGHSDGDIMNYFKALGGSDIVLLDKDEFNDGVPSYEDNDELRVDIDDNDDTAATVWWDLSSTGAEAWYVVVKDGAKDAPIQWIWYEVSATTSDYQRVIGGGNVDTSTNGGGAISFISLLGKRGTSVPDASVMLLLGSSFLGLAVFSKKRKTS
jgi:hypothetical protein